MKILNIHGLNGSCHNTNYNTLVDYYSSRTDVEIISPQIDYEVTSPSEIILSIVKTCPNPDIVVGNSFGGFFAYILGLLTNAKTLLVNPCIPPHEYIPNLVSNYHYTDELERIWKTHKIHKPNYALLLGDSDEVLDINRTLNILGNKNLRIIHGGHSLNGEEYKSWFKENLT